MATKARLMATGMSAFLANHIGQDASSTIAGAGTTQATATSVTSNFTVVSTAAANTGVILTQMPGSAPVVVIRNGGINTVKVYGDTTSAATINGTVGSTGFSLTAAKTLILVGTEGAWIGIMSA